MSNFQVRFKKHPLDQAISIHRFVSECEVQYNLFWTQPHRAYICHSFIRGAVDRVNVNSNPILPSPSSANVSSQVMENIELQPLDPGEPQPYVDNINTIDEQRHRALAAIDKTAFSYVYRRLLVDYY